jgi:hypothetical protein
MTAEPIRDCKGAIDHKSSQRRDSYSSFVRTSFSIENINVADLIKSARNGRVHNPHIPATVSRGLHFLHHRASELPQTRSNQLFSWPDWLAKPATVSPSRNIAISRFPQSK